MNAVAERARTTVGGGTVPVAADVAGVPLSLVNVYLVGPPGAGDRGWVLVDAGMSFSADRIAREAAARFGPAARPLAIVLTHGHFDHVGSVQTLAERWDAPVFAHPLELPYLTGRSDYPPFDPVVGGGLMARMAPLFSRKAIDLGDRVKPLAADGSVPGMPGWRWVHTPGHTPGHVSLFREADRVLIVGDAFVTTKQESAVAALAGLPMVCRPPAYATTDWAAAGRSVRALERLQPEVAATGHGLPMRGQQLRHELATLAFDFGRSVPSAGRYVGDPARADRQGVTYVPPPAADPLPYVLAVAGAVAVGAFVASRGGDRSS